MIKNFFAASLLLGLFTSTPAEAVPGKVVPKDALVLEKGVVIRQFGDNRGKVIAKPEVCDELLLLEPVRFKGGYEEVLFLSADALQVRRGWIKPSSQLYVFPEPRPILPRSDTTPGVAFPWASKSPQPGDPDFARVTNKIFLFTCLERPHPAKAAAVLTQILDRYVGELTAEDVGKLLPVLRYARDEDRPRIRELLKKFKEDPSVKEFVAANPIFGDVIEPEQKPPSQSTPRDSEEDKAVGKLFGVPYKILAFGIGGFAVLLILIALVMRRKKRTSDTITMPSDRDPSM